ncbi:MAG: hypothetical protein RL368_1758, partial [Pseudomonadota bacterium]|jgi:hypothetical protein
MACEKIAETDEGNLLQEEAKFRILQTKLSRQLSNDFKEFSNVEICNTEILRSFLSLLPLPTFYWNLRKLELPISQDSKTLEKNETNPLLYLLIFIDKTPIASPQFLKQHIQYNLTFKIRGFIWLSNANRLQLDFISTCPKNDYSMSDFILERPLMDNGEYNAEIMGQISFKIAQSSLSDDLVFQIRAAFEMSDGSFRVIPIIGYSELRLKIVNEYPIKTENKLLDKYVTELIIKLLNKFPHIREELPDLLPILDALTRLKAMYFQNAIWKGKDDISEADFQEKVLQDLRLILGQDVQEHTAQAGGSTDIRYCGVIVELKVEKKNSDRKHMAQKYSSQVTQYAGVEARQVSILLVLDLTEKLKPTGDIRDDIFLQDVETHGGDDSVKKFPSKVFVFVINGNMKSPSHYSK